MAYQSALWLPAATGVRRQPAEANRTPIGRPWNWGSSSDEADYEHRLRGRPRHRKVQIEPSYRHRPGRLGNTPWIVYSPSHCPGVSRQFQLMAAADRRIGTPESALPTKWKPSLAFRRRGAWIHQCRKYQGLEALTQQAVRRPDSSDVDDSSCLAQWRLASPEPRSDVRDGVPVIQVWRKRGDSRLGAQSRQPERSIGGGP